MKESWLSELQQNILSAHNLKPSKVKKLLQTFHTKEKYVLHYITLKLYVQLGLVVKDVHYVLKFRQEKVFAKFVQLNNALRKQAKTKNESGFTNY